MARFPHASDAEKAGYVRYTNEDNTGSISYANFSWTSDPTHPSQLWYDKSGNLLGADDISGDREWNARSMHYRRD